MTLILLSTAYGDAHGFPFELSKGDRDASRVRGVMAIPGPREWTDDTEFSIALTDTLLDGPYRPRTAMHYYEYAAAKLKHGLGGTLRKACDAFRAGMPVPQCGVVGSLGNGTVMRCAPIGLAYRDEPWVAGEVAALDALTTHRSPEAQEGSRLIAAAIAFLTREDPGLVARPALLEYLNKYVATSYDSKKVLDQLQSMYDRGLPPDLPMSLTFEHKVSALPTAFFALASFIFHVDMTGGIASIISYGGDTDTNAAIAGALYGAYGHQQLPFGIADVKPPEGSRSEEMYNREKARKDDLTVAQWLNQKEQMLLECAYG
jgi:ADP-ribosyl-[dinitrogen reductase] hydrolase